MTNPTENNRSRPIVATEAQLRLLRVQREVLERALRQAKGEETPEPKEGERP